jgi:hypothetical protein
LKTAAPFVLFRFSLFLQRIYSQAATSGMLMSTQVAGSPLGA